MLRFAWLQHRKQILLLLIPLAIIGFVCTTIDRNHVMSGTNQGMLDIVRSSVVTPLLMGLFWGAPAFSKEYEEGTTNLVLMQGISRKRWFATKAGLLLGAAAIYGLLFTLVVSTWWTPHGRIFPPLDFDTTGIVPIFYSVAAVAIGMLIGVWRKRVVASIAITLFVIVGLQFSVANFVRPHYEPALTFHYQLSTCHTTYFPNTKRIESHYCDLTKNSAYYAFTNDTRKWDISLTGPITYQPGNRYWPFQLIESTGYAALTGGLVFGAYEILLRNDNS